jgi:DinB superfamily
MEGGPSPAYVRLRKQERGVKTMDETEVHEHLTFLKETPSKVKRLLDGMDQSMLRLRPSPDEFSAVEQICHLRDIERDGYSERISRILSEDQPRLRDIDGARLAIERDYNSQDAPEALNSFAAARAANVALLSQLNSDQMDREGELEEVGRVSIRRLVATLREHDEGHLDELNAIHRRLYHQ